MPIDIEKLTNENNRVTPAAQTFDASFFNFKQVYDLIAGTLIDVGQRPNPDYPNNNPQTTYKFKVEMAIQNGEKLEPGNYIYGSKPAVDKQMANTQLGQIMVLKFVALGKPKAGKNAAHIIVVYSEGQMDEEWLKENRPGVASATSSASASPISSPLPTPPPSTPPDTTPVTNITTPSAKPVYTTLLEKMTAVSESVKQKFNANSPQEIKDMVVSKCGLEFTEANLDAILAKLETLPSEK